MEQALAAYDQTTVAPMMSKPRLEMRSGSRDALAQLVAQPLDACGKP